MGLKQEELISRYFEHSMSPGEEQNFLISLAASDQMRIAFRSHLELMKAVRDDKDDLRSVAQVRTRTLAALGISAAAVTPFIEQELLRNAPAQKQPEIVNTAAIENTTAIRTASETAHWYSRFSNVLHTRKFALGTGLMLGFSAATLLVNVSSDNQATQMSSRNASAPSQSVAGQPQHNAVVAPPQGTSGTPVVSASSSNETIPPSEGLNSVARPSTSNAGTTTTAANAEAGTSRHGTSTGFAHDATSLSPSTKSTTAPPVVNASRKGNMYVKPLVITSPKDSGGAK